MTLAELRTAVDHLLPRDPKIEPRDLDLNVAVWALEQLRMLLDALAADSTVEAGVDRQLRVHP